MDIFRRLTILLALSSFVVLLGSAAYSFYKFYSVQQSVSGSYETFNRALSICEKHTESPACWIGEQERKHFYELVAERERYRELVKNFLIATIGSPLLLLFIYLGYGWVAYEKIPKI